MTLNHKEASMRWSAQLNSTRLVSTRLLSGLILLVCGLSATESVAQVRPLPEIDAQADLVRAAQQGFRRAPVMPAVGERPVNLVAPPVVNDRAANNGAINNADVADSENRRYSQSYTRHERRVMLLRDWEVRARESGRRYAQSLQRPVTPEEVAAARLRLAKLHFKQGRDDLGRKWLLDLAERFPDSPAAVEGTDMLALLVR